MICNAPAVHLEGHVRVRGSRSRYAACFGGCFTEGVEFMEEQAEVTLASAVDAFLGVVSMSDLVGMPPEGRSGDF